MLAVLTSLYFAFVLLVPLGYAAIVAAAASSASARIDARLAGHAVVAAALAAAVLAPVLLRYQRVAAAHGFERTTAESARYSADVVSYVSVWHQAGFRPFLRDERTVVRALFPGVVIAGLAAAAFRLAPADLDGARRWTWGAPDRRRRAVRRERACRRAVRRRHAGPRAVAARGALAAAGDDGRRSTAGSPRWPSCSRSDRCRRSTARRSRRAARTPG